MHDEKAQIILDYLLTHNTMVLSTYGEDGSWSTPVFYINRGFHLYFLSEPTSKHSCNIRENPLIAASITEDYRDYQKIQGIQLRGHAGLLRNLKETAVILALYLKKYPEVRQILTNVNSFKGVLNARWHYIRPEFIKFTDNTCKFGERLEICLKDIEG